MEELLSNLGPDTMCAVIIGCITLGGAAVGLMNIMLVAVTERTKEIGLVKAIGGRKECIRMQFLYESIIISLLGAVFGSILGILVGNSFFSCFKYRICISMGLAFPGYADLYVVGILAGFILL